MKFARVATLFMMTLAVACTPPANSPESSSTEATSHATPAPADTGIHATVVQAGGRKEPSRGRLATVVVTPAAEQKKFSAFDASAVANSDLKSGMPWTDAVKKASAKLGKPAFTTTSPDGREVLWWSAETAAGKCYVVQLGRHVQKLDGATAFPFEKGSEGIALDDGAGYVDPCAAKVSATEK